MDVSNEKRRLNEMGWYVSTGSLLLIQDARETARSLTEVEAMSVQRAREAEKKPTYINDYYYSDNYTSSYPVADSVKKSGAAVAPRAVGIHIRKHNESKEQISQSQSDSDLASSTVDAAVIEENESVISETNASVAITAVTQDVHMKNTNYDDVNHMFL